MLLETSLTFVATHHPAFIYVAGIWGRWVQSQLAWFPCMDAGWATICRL